MGKDNNSLPEEVVKSTESHGLSTVVEAIAGDEPDKIDLTWVEENITSIQNAVSSGKHDKLFYPASGTDILRTLIAYDVTEVVAVDPGSDLIPRIMEQFDKAKIPLSITKVDDVTDELSCIVGGKQRKITFKRADARLIIDKLEPGSVDVLHVFLPTGADTEVTEDEVWLQKKFGDEWRMKQGTDEAEQLMKQDSEAPIANENGKYRQVATGVRNQLTLDNYNLVSAGGMMDPRN